ncbi:MAG: copper resistance protein CopC, partial [Nitrosopumilaceae archaeon]
AYGHATIVKTEPANGQQIKNPPSEITIHYSEGVQLVEISVFDSDGNKKSQRPQIDSTDNRIVTISLQEIGDGVYTVSWQVLSVDGHTTNDNFFFIVGDEIPSRSVFLELYSPKETKYNVSFEEPFLRWLTLSSLVILVGMPVSMILVIQPDIRNLILDKKRKFLRNLLVCGSLVIAASATILAVKQMSSVYTSINLENFFTFIFSTLGISWIAKLVLVFILIGILLSTKSWKMWVVSAIAVGIMMQLTISLTSHSTSIIGGAIPFVTDFSHLFASSIWVGGVFLLAVIVIPIIGGKNESFPRNRMITTIKRFSILAVSSVTALVITGLVMTSWHVPSFDSVFLTIYGTVLSIKIGLLATAFVIGSSNRFVVPRLLAKSPDKKFLRSLSNLVRIELVVLFLVLAMSGILTSVQPAASEFTEHKVEEKFSITENIDDITATIDITPKQVGLNVFDVHLTKDGKPLTYIKDPRILLTLSEKKIQLPQFDLKEIEPGLYSGFGTFTFGGEWDVRFSAIIDGKYATERFPVNTETQHESHLDHKADENTLDFFSEMLLVIALVVVGVAGIIIAYE